MRVIHAQQQRVLQWNRQRVAGERAQRTGVAADEHHRLVVRRGERFIQPFAAALGHSREGFSARRHLAGPVGEPALQGVVATPVQQRPGLAVPLTEILFVESVVDLRQSSEAAREWRQCRVAALPRG